VSAVVVAISVPRTPCVKSFEGRREGASYRLTAQQQGDLRAVFTEEDTGLRSSWQSEVDGCLGGERAVHLFDGEAHCDRARVFKRKDGKDGPHVGRAAWVHRAYRALYEIGSEGDGLTVSVLRREYGSPLPSARFDLFGEVAPLFDLCPAVLTIAETYERDRKDRARVRFEKFWDGEDAVAAAAAAAYHAGLLERPAWGCTRGSACWTLGYELLWTRLLAERARHAKPPGRARALHLLDHVLADAPLDTSRAMREALDARIEIREGESKRARAERTRARADERAGFILDVRIQGDSLLAEASRAYRKVWGKQ
jgi:hypothetical protein